MKDSANKHWLREEVSEPWWAVPVYLLFVLALCGELFWAIIFK